MGEKFLKLCHEPISYALRFAVNTSTSYEMTKIVRALWLAERRVCMSKMFCFSRANRASTKRFWIKELDKFTLFRGVARIFQRGGHSRDAIQGSPTIYGLYRCSPSCISGLSHIIAAWRPVLTKDKSRWRKYFPKKQILKKWAFQQWLLRPRYCHGVFATWILYVVCSKEGLPRGGGGHGHPMTPPSYAPVIYPFPRRFKLEKSLETCSVNFFPLSWHFKREKPVFWKASFLQNKDWLRVQASCTRLRDW